MKQKRFICMLFGFFVAVLCLLLSAKAEAATVASGSCGDGVKWSYSDSGNLTISGSGAMTDYTETLSQIPWYSYTENIKSISIGSGVTHIGNYAFAGCYNAKYVTIGSSVKTIGAGSFMACLSITSLSIPKAVTVIGPGAFAYCEALTSCIYQVDAKLTTVDVMAFFNCSSLTRVKLPYSTRVIGTYAYMNCSALNELYIQTGVTTIGMCAFASCTALKSVSIPSTVTQIEGGPFAYCTALTKITMLSSSYVSENGWIYSADRTVLVQAPATLSGSCVIPDTVNTIACAAFVGCENMTAVTIPANVTVIQDEAFGGCEGLTAVTLPENLIYLGIGCFNTCTSLTSIVIPDKVDVINASTFEDCSKLTSVTIGKGVVAIDSQAFRKCTSLYRITIPDNVTYLGNGVFSECTKLYYVSLGNGVSVIDYQAFFGCSQLKEIVIPESVLAVRDKSFCNCSALRKIIFRGNAPVFEKDTFGAASKLKAIYLESDPTWTEEVLKSYGGHLIWVGVPDLSCIDGGSCGSNAKWFFKEDGTLLVTGTGDMEQWSNQGYVPWNNYRYDITKVIIEDGITSVGKCAFQSSKITEITLPDSMTTIEQWAFSGCEQLKSVSVQNSIYEVAGDAFNQTLWLEEHPAGPIFFGNILYKYKENGAEHYTVPAGTLGISSGAFSGCTLKSVDLPDSLQYIGATAFISCKNLEAITIPDSITVIEERTFSACSNLKSISFGAGVTKISYGAFWSCVQLEAITLPINLQNIDENAFIGCQKLKSIKFIGDAPSFHTNAFTGTNATAYYPADNATWTTDVQKPYGGTIAWIAYERSGVMLSDGAAYDSFAAAMEDYDASRVYIRLMSDQTADVELTQDLYIDMNGHNLTGTIKTNGFKIYGMDSTTDAYNGDLVGQFSCVNENGNPVIPVNQFKTDKTGVIRRYLAVADENGYSFHRFYFALTSMTIRPSTIGVGYKAVFYGDAQVLSMLDQNRAFSYTIQLDGRGSVTATKGRDDLVSGKAISLRIDNFDVENFADTALTAKLTLRLADGTVLQGSPHSLTFRGMLEYLHDIYNTIDTEKLNAIRAMVEQNPVMQTWDVFWFIPWEDDGTIPWG